MVYDRRLLRNIREVGRTVRINVAKKDATPTETNLKGDLHLPGGDLIVEALWVPGFRKNLISVYQLTAQTGGTVTFTSSGCTAVDSTGKVVLQGTAENGLYKLMPHLEQAHVADSRHPDQWKLWHARIGHSGRGLIRCLRSRGFLRITGAEPDAVYMITIQIPRMESLLLGGRLFVQNDSAASRVAGEGVGTHSMQ